MKIPKRQEQWWINMNQKELEPRAWHVSETGEMLEHVSFGHQRIPAGLFLWVSMNGIEVWPGTKNEYEALLLSKN